MFDFIDFDFKINKDDFIDIITDTISGSQDYDDFTFDIQEKKTKYGKTLYTVNFDDNGSNESFDIIADKTSPTSQEMWFHYMKLANFNYGFARSSNSGMYESLYSVFLKEVFQEAAKKTKGRLVALEGNVQNITVIEKGNRLDSKKTFDIAVRDIAKNSYYYKSTDISQDNEEDDEDEDDFKLTKFKVKKPIFDWVRENPDLVGILQGKSMETRMDIIGKYLMKKKLDGDIDSDLFINLYTQCGIIGFSDPTTKKFYSLIM